MMANVNPHENEEDTIPEKADDSKPTLPKSDSGAFFEIDGLSEDDSDDDDDDEEEKDDVKYSSIFRSPKVKDDKDSSVFRSPKVKFSSAPIKVTLFT